MSAQHWFSFYTSWWFHNLCYHRFFFAKIIFCCLHGFLMGVGTLPLFFHFFSGWLTRSVHPGQQYAPIDYKNSAVCVGILGKYDSVYSIMFEHRNIDPHSGPIRFYFNYKAPCIVRLELQLDASQLLVPLYHIIFLFLLYLGELESVSVDFS